MTSPAPRARRVLAESFYERFFYNDLFGSHDDPQLSAANLMAMLVFPGMLCLYLIPKYYVTLRHAPEHVRALEVLGDRYLWFAYSMSVMGLLTALQWERLFPDERDYFVVGPQPVPTRAVFEAQALALARYLGLFALVIHVGSAFFFPIGAVRLEAGLLEGLGFSLAHWLSLALSSLFVVSAVTALQGVLLALLPARVFRRISSAVQLLVALAFCALIVLLPALRSWVFSGVESVDALASSVGSALLLPPLWFAAFGDWLAAPFSGPLGELATRALAMTMAVFLFAAASYWLGYRRFLKRSLESSDVRPRTMTRPRSRLMARLMGGAGASRAAALFSIKTLSRSPRQRLEFGAWLAIGLALVVAQSWSMTQETFADRGRLVLAQPFLLLLVGLAGLRRAYELPAELPAHWVFRLCATREPALYHEGSRRATFLVAVLPLAAISTALAAWLWGCAAAWVHVVSFSLVGLAAVEAARLGTRKIPFTCSYVAARAHAVIVWTLSAVGILLGASLLAELERKTFDNLWLLLPVASIAAGLAVLRAAIEDDRSRPQELLFEESSDPFPNRLRLRG